MRAAILFQIASLALVWSSTRWFGYIIGIGAIVLHLALSASAKQEVLAILTFAVIGAVCENVLAWSGLIAFGPDTPFSPPWVVLLWAAMGTLAHGPMSALREKPWLAALLAAIFGPLSFLGGEAANVITITRPLPLSLLGISVAMSLTLASAFVVCARTRASALQP